MANTPEKHSDLIRQPDEEDFDSAEDLGPDDESALSPTEAIEDLDEDEDLDDGE